MTIASCTSYQLHADPKNFASWIIFMQVMRITLSFIGGPKNKNPAFTLKARYFGPRSEFSVLKAEDD